MATRCISSRNIKVINMVAIKFNNVTKEYKTSGQSVKALDNVSFEIEDNKMVVVLGPSGSGKSTMLNLIGGMDNVTDGNIVFYDKDITTLRGKKLTKYRREDVGFVFQFYNLIPNLTVYENVDIVRKFGTNSFDVNEMLAAVGLEKRAKHFPAELSGGELQRLSIARALCKNPKILLCDEPTGALDSVTGRNILLLLQKMSCEYNKTVIIVTHNANIAKCADEVIHIKDGKINAIEINEHKMRVEEIDW